MQLTPDTRREYRAPSVPHISAWSIPKVRAALDLHENGQFQGSALLAAALGRNPRIEAALTTRVLGCMGLPFKWVEPDAGTDRLRTRSVAWCKRVWRKALPLTVEIELRRWALLMGIAPAEIVWRYEAGEWLPRVKVWNPTFLSWNEAERRFDINTLDGLVPFTPGDGRWLALSYGDSEPWMRGVVRCLGIPDAIRGFAVRDWARWSEVHGLPIRIAKVPQTASEPEKDRFFNEVANLGSENTVLAPFTPDGAFDVDLKEATDKAHEGFLALIQNTSADVCVALLGQEQSQGASPTVYVPKAVGDGIRRDYQEADAVISGEVFRAQLVCPAIGFNFGADAIDSAPTPTYDAAVPADLAAAAKTLDTFGDALTKIKAGLAGSGFRAVTRKLAERFDVPLEVDPDPTPPPAPLAAPGTPGKAPGATPAAPAPAKGAPGALARSGDGPAPLIAGQVFVDDLRDAAQREAPAALASLLARVNGAIEASASYDDLRARLLTELEGEVSPEALRALLTGAVTVAQAAGAWSIAREAE